MLDAVVYLDAIRTYSGTSHTDHHIFHEIIDEYDSFDFSIYFDLMEKIARRCGYQNGHKNFIFCFIPDFDKTNVFCGDPLTVTSNIRNVFFKDETTGECTILKNIKVFATKNMHREPEGE